jgi:mercuric reductase
MATGVSPNTDGLNLDKANVNVNKNGFILVDDFGKTTNSNIWAAGDVIGEIFLETTSARQGYNAAKNIFENANMSIDYATVPKTIFTMPQVASVGLSEDEIQERNIEYDSSTITLDLIPKALALKDTRGIIKMNIDSTSRQVLGIHIVAPNASELIHEATLIVRFKLTIDDVIDTLHVFPTMSEGIKRAAQSFERDIETMACCVN